MQYFLLLKFHVKSFLDDFRGSKTAILAILEALNFDFWKKFILEMSKIPKTLKTQSSQNGQNGIFRDPKITKIDFT